MGRHAARPKKKADKPSEIVAKVAINGEEVELKEPAPKGFPPRLYAFVGDCMRRAFEAGYQRGVQQPLETISLADLASSSGRPLEPQVEDQGRRAAQLREEGLTYGQIATRLCYKKSEPHHRCGKRCADRIRQAHQSYVKREKQRQIEEELTSFE